MKILLTLILLGLPAFAGASSLHCDGEDAGYEWTYDIALQGDQAKLVYQFNDWRSEHAIVLTERGFKVPSPFEFESDSFLRETDHGWDLELWNFDGTRNGYVIKEFFCTVVSK
jgi:hypothetical protein